ncbi:PREDICTED: pectinesterase 1-like, partial [Erythranthe guttata]|uniref:pectinesterase 1-like n=1 Tax=Erythranthe guttata TaxID=4155 RepID=UPI00064D847F
MFVYFSFGQTGSGKTYTVNGPNSSSVVDCGVNYRALNDLFSISQKRNNSYAYEAFNINIPSNSILNSTAASSGRLLEEDHDHDDDGTSSSSSFPAWLPAGDRKLLASKSGGGGQPAPNAVVAQDGSGGYKTISAALAAYPKNHKGRYVIYVKAGVYDETVTITKDLVNVYMYGDGPRKSIVTGKKCFTDGVSTFQTAPFSKYYQYHHARTHACSHVLYINVHID